MALIRSCFTGCVVLSFLAACAAETADAGETTGQPSAQTRLGWSSWSVVEEPVEVIDSEILALLGRDSVRVEDERLGEETWLLAGPIPGTDLGVWVTYPRYPVEMAEAGIPRPLSLRRGDEELPHYKGYQGDPADLPAHAFTFAKDKVGLMLPTGERPGGDYRLSYWTRSEHVLRAVGDHGDVEEPVVLLADRGEARRTIALPPPGAIAAEVRVPVGAVLHLGYLAHGRSSLRLGDEGIREVAAQGDGVGFRLTVECEGVSEVAWSDFVLPGEPPGFRDAAVSLAEYGGKNARLILSTFASEGATDDRRDDYAVVCLPYLDAATAEQPPDVLLVVLDTLRADALGCYGNPRDLTPHLDRLAREGQQFANALSPSPWTLPAHSTLFTSLFPSQHRVMGRKDVLPDRFETLAEVLERAGWRTAAFTDGGFVTASYGLHQGFQWFDGRAGGAEVVFDRAARWLAATEGPAFAFVQTYEVHLPYEPPPEERQRWVQPYDGPLPRVVNQGHLDPPVVGDFTESDIRYVKELYDAGVAYADRCFADFREQLQASGDWDETLVIVTSDHGEGFMEHGDFAHDHTLYEELVRVPLIVRYPGRFERREPAAHPVRLADIPATVLDVVGVEAPPAWIGIPLDRLPNQRDLFANLYTGAGHAVYDRTARFKWIAMPDNGYRTGRKFEQGEFYDLESDPGEQNNLCDPEIVKAHTERLFELLEKYPDLTDGESATAEITAAHRAALHGLGYVR